MNLPADPVDDNQPLDFVVSVTPDIPFTINQIWNEPVGTSPQNLIGTTDMNFTINGSDVNIEKAIWYGDAAGDLCFGDPLSGDKNVASHTIKAKIEVHGQVFTVEDQLGVNLNDGTPPNIPGLERGGIANTTYSGQFPLMITVQITGPSIISKSGTLLNLDKATSQYRDKIIEEEAAHENQWHGSVVNSDAGLPSFHHGDLVLEEVNVINALVAQGGTYDSVARTIKFSGEFRSTVESYVDNAVENEVSRIGICASDRRCITEKTAKDMVGFQEAYTYECAYPNCPDNPTSPCP